MPKPSRANHSTSSHRTTPYTTAPPVTRAPAKATATAPPSITSTATTMAGTSPTPTERHNASPWSSSDDTQLMHARQKGLNWQPIASKYFPTKTANACRKRHERLMEKRNSADSWDGVKIEQLARAYIEVREEMWEVLAKLVGEKWQDVEKKCMEKGVKTLQNVSRTVKRREHGNDGVGTNDHSSSDFEHDDHQPYQGHREDQTCSRPRDERQSTYSVDPVSIPTGSYSSHRTWSTTSSASAFTPVSTTAPQRQQQPRFPHVGHQNIASIASLLSSPPVTTH